MGFSSDEIGKRAEATVVSDLRNKGLSIIEWNTKALGSTDIVAYNPLNQKYIRVQVKGAIFPSLPSSLSFSESMNIRNLSQILNHAPVLAKVVLNNQLNPISISYSGL